MKTSEFRKYLKSEWNFKEYDDYFEIHNIGKIFKSSNAIINLCLSNGKGELLSKIYEYAKTPLEEREEEKKYRLKIKFNTYQYLNFNTDLETYSIDNVKEIDEIRTSFTQKEIDAMPFDTNFFIKEEV